MYIAELRITISQNIDFIDKFDPEYVLVLSGDHIYKMNPDKMLAAHKEAKADATIAVIGVPMKEASRFGIMNTDGSGRIVKIRRETEHRRATLHPWVSISSPGNSSARC